MIHHETSIRSKSRKTTAVPEQENVALGRAGVWRPWRSLPPPRFLGGQADLPIPRKLSRIPTDMPMGTGQCHSPHKRGEEDKTLILTVGESKQRTKREGGLKELRILFC